MSKSPHICIKEELYKRYIFALMIYIQFPQRCQVKKANYRIQIYELIDEAKSQAMNKRVVKCGGQIGKHYQAITKFPLIFLKFAKFMLFFFKLLKHII